MRVALFITCLTDTHYPRAGIAVVKVLEHLGHEVVFPAGQTCCGQPMFNAGQRDHARSLARRMLDLFEPHDCVVTPSASCAAMVRDHFVELFDADAPDRERARRLSARTYEFVEFLQEVLHLDLAALAPRWEGAVAIHDSCHGRSIGVAGRARPLLEQIPGVRIAPLAREEECCGFGGAFAVRYPIVSGAMATDKAAAIAASGAATVACGDAGCAMNIEGACRRAGHDHRFQSAGEVIAEALGLLPRETTA
ncbi:MAG: (Fe-S)-binding protein [Phycisphaerales bacterium]|nr:(Fe-S)-binding protein [Phycisphaerales bacterium]